jgi:hypothetical protein
MFKWCQLLSSHKNLGSSPGSIFYALWVNSPIVNQFTSKSNDNCFNDFMVCVNLKIKSNCHACFTTCVHTIAVAMTPPSAQFHSLWRRKKFVQQRTCLSQFRKFPWEQYFSGFIYKPVMPILLPLFLQSFHSTAYHSPQPPFFRHQPTAASAANPSLLIHIYLIYDASISHCLSFYYFFILSPVD